MLGDAAKTSGLTETQFGDMGKLETSTQDRRGVLSKRRKREMRGGEKVGKEISTQNQERRKKVEEERAQNQKKREEQQKRGRNRRSMKKTFGKGRMGDAARRDKEDREKSREKERAGGQSNHHKQGNKGKGKERLLGHVEDWGEWAQRNSIHSAQETSIRNRETIKEEW